MTPLQNQNAAHENEAPHSKELIVWLWKNYLSNYTPIIIFAAICMIFEGAMVGALSYLIKPMFDQVLTVGNTGAVFWVAAAVFAVFFIRAIAAFGHKSSVGYVNNKIFSRLQSNLLAHMLTLDGKFFQENAPGTLIERTRGDTAAASTIWSSMLTGVGRDMVALISLLSVAILADWVWALMAIAGLPLIALPISSLQKRVRKKATLARQTAARLSTRLDEIFHGANIIKLSGTEKRETARFKAEADNFASLQQKTLISQAGIPVLIDIIAGLGFAGVLIYGGLQIIDGTKTVGEFMSFFTAIGLAFDPLRRLGNLTGQWQAARSSIERVTAVFDETATITDPPSPKSLSIIPTKADINFENVVFSYSEAPVLRGISFTAQAGKMTALVGASGAGKSTIFHLLTRLADPQSGTIKFADTSSKELTIKDLRGLFSVVSQENLLFDESLRENILMGSDATEENFLKALQAAHVDDFAGTLEHGLDTAVGPRGSALSGGQRQRVAIARAILRDRPILLLDEATSALDTKSETIVREGLEKLSEGRTTLVIAHRLSTIQSADKIIVMDKGQIVDQGTHDELLSRGGVYSDLHRLQFSE